MSDKKDLRTDLAHLREQFNGYLQHRQAAEQGIGARPDAPVQDTRAINGMAAEVRERLKGYTGKATGEMAIIEVVDRLVNERIKYQKERIDNWSSGAAVAARGADDCDGYAALKAELLVKMGIPPERVGIGVLYPKKDGESGHAVTIYKAADGSSYVLDNSGADSGFNGVSTLYDYLKHDKNGRDQYPVAFARMDGKIEPNEKIKDGRIARADMEPQLPRASLQDLEQIHGLKDVASAIVAKHTGIELEQSRQFLGHAPNDFAQKLAEALADKDLRDKLNLKPEQLQLVQNYAEELAKAPKAAQPEAAPPAPQEAAPPTAEAEAPRTVARRPAMGGMGMA